MNNLLKTGQVIILSISLISTLAGQEASKKHTIDSYISILQAVMIDSLKGNWMTDNQIYNRINYFWYPNEHFTFSTQFRNRFIYGETVKSNPEYASSIDYDPGLMDLSLNLVNEKSFFINTSIDRLFLKYSRGKLVTTIGRQRINWGQNYVWNPNDIYNVQNYFDFDYIEKPGSDAIRMQYYTGVASEAEIALKLNHDHKVTGAAYYRFNKWGYDFQSFGGIFEGVDYVIGAGFAGHIGPAGFTGEITYFKPIENFKDTSSILLFGMGADYIFSNSIHLQVEGLYKYSKETGSKNDFLAWYSGSLGVKELSFTEFSFFTSISYPFTPLINGSFACMLFPEIKGFFTGPTLSYSASDNIQLSLITQRFSGVFPDAITGIEKRTSLLLGFIQFKINF
jgi:hypothetical protein